MANCPHCMKELGSGYLDEETHKARLKAKEDRNKALEEEIKTSREKAAGYDTAVRERDEARSKLEAAETRGARTVALAQAGITDPATAKRVESIFGLYKDETGEGAAEFDAWLSGPAREDVLLAPLFAGKGTGGAPGNPGKAGEGKGAGKGAATAGKSGLPAASAGAADPPSQGKQSPAQIRAYLQSPEYRALPVAEQKAKLAELQKAPAPAPT